uniref:HNH endonuclease n=1 Tax=Rosenbergiella metrosideri TaxID=2921185 RepID=UPI001F4F22D9
NTPIEHKEDRLKIINSHLYMKDGEVRYKNDSSKYSAIKRKAGDKVHVSFNNNGYQQVCFGGVQMFLHSIVFSLTHGRLPNGEIDHINGNRGDNSPANLRECTRSQNNRNLKTNKKNTSGFKNVSWVSQKSKWHVSLRTDQGRISFGLYEDLEFAGLVAQSAREKFHLNFARSL